MFMGGETYDYLQKIKYKTKKFEISEFIYRISLENSAKPDGFAKNTERFTTMIRKSDGWVVEIITDDLNQALGLTL